MTEKILAIMRREGTRIMLIVCYQFNDYLALYSRKENDWMVCVRAHIIRYNRWITTDRVRIAEVKQCHSLSN